MVDLNIEVLEEEQSQDWELVPTGWHTAEISNAEVRTSASSGFDYLSCEFTITSDSAANRKVWTVFSLWHEREDVVEWAKQKVSDLGRAAGMTHVGSEEALIGKVVQIKVGRNKEGDREEVKGYRTPSNGHTPTPPTIAAVGNSKQPWAA